MEKQKRNGLEKPIKDELELNELTTVEGGTDSESDEGWCIIGQCYQAAEKTCYSNVG